MINSVQQQDCFNIVQLIRKVQYQTFQIAMTDSRVLKEWKSAINKKHKFLEQLQKVSSLNRNKFKCLFCQESYEDDERLYHHYIGAHLTKSLFYGPTKFSCRVCYKEFKGAINLLLHERNTNHKKRYLFSKASQIHLTTVIFNIIISYCFQFPLHHQLNPFILVVQLYLQNIHKFLIFFNEALFLLQCVFYHSTIIHSNFSNPHIIIVQDNSFNNFFSYKSKLLKK
ncbi:hypothetical protein pb186bvf_011665 [Paramecium bursaria]